MQAQWKYVVALDDSGAEVLETFGAGIVHADFAVRNGISPSRIISAGYMTADRECFGASSSLGKKSRPRADTALARDD